MELLESISSNRLSPDILKKARETSRIKLYHLMSKWPHLNTHELIISYKANSTILRIARDECQALGLTLKDNPLNEKAVSNPAEALENYYSVVQRGSLNEFFDERRIFWLTTRKDSIKILETYSRMKSTAVALADIKKFDSQIDKLESICIEKMVDEQKFDVELKNLENAVDTRYLEIDKILKNVDKDFQNFLFWEECEFNEKIGNLDMVFNGNNILKRTMAEAFIKNDGHFFGRMILNGGYSLVVTTYVAVKLNPFNLKWLLLRSNWPKLYKYVERLSTDKTYIALSKELVLWKERLAFAKKLGYIKQEKSALNKISKISIDLHNVVQVLNLTADKNIRMFLFENEVITAFTLRMPILMIMKSFLQMIQRKIVQFSKIEGD